MTVYYTTSDTPVVIRWIFENNTSFTGSYMLFLICKSQVVSVNFDIEGSKVSICGGYPEKVNSKGL